MVLRVDEIGVMSSEDHKRFWASADGVGEFEFSFDEEVDRDLFEMIAVKVMVAEYVGENIREDHQEWQRLLGSGLPAFEYRRTEYRGLEFGGYRRY